MTLSLPPLSSKYIYCIPLLSQQNHGVCHSHHPQPRNSFSPETENQLGLGRPGMGPGELLPLPARTV